jgi:eukaryotic-like serine/threonine-protein kinase
MSTDRLAAALADRYAIERELGAGGMATVYLARDLKHERPVALKVLRPELAAILGSARFLQEIRTTAHLQHPHILPLHDSGEAEGTVFYVMPYVEGESLRERLRRDRQLPVDEAVRLAGEVASALDYAHRHGIVHRDIKPENILLHEGQALVADFGIALAVSRSDGGTRLTETGMSLGTPHYMAPEQAMGQREITGQADVYALGCVMYEMLTGEPPFTGATAQAIVARVLTEPPRGLTLQRHTIPPHVEAAVLRALEKLPADRFATAGEFAVVLSDSAYRGTPPIRGAAQGTERKRRWRAGMRLLLAVLGGMAAGAVLWAVLRPPPRPLVTRYGLALPPSQAPDPTWRAIPAPDGARIIYVGPAEAGTQLWVKTRDRYEATPLAGTLGVGEFAFSPDGEWIAFTLAGALRKLPVVGGAAITLAGDAAFNPGLAWLDDGTIVYIGQGGTRLHRIPASGGASSVVLADSDALLLPTPLPGGRGVLFCRCAGADCVGGEDLWALDLRTGEAHHVLSGAKIGQYVQTGHVIYVRQDGGMLAVPFDLDALETRGSPVPVMDGVAVNNAVYPLAAVSSSGTLVVRMGAGVSSQDGYEAVWVSRDGREAPVDSTWTFRLTNYGANAGWALSPDGTRLAIGLATEAGDDIWVKQLPRGPVSRVSSDSAAEYRPRWRDDGRSLMFGSNRGGGGAGGLYVRAADGTGSDTAVVRSPQGIFEGAWSPDGRWLLFRTGGVSRQTGGRDIVGMRPGVDTVPVPVVASAFDEEAIALSPDGRWLAYESNETGRTEVFLRPFPQTEGGKWQVSNGGGVAPLWARNGRELFYVDQHRDMMTVTVTRSAEPPLGERRRLFHLRDELYLTSQEFYTPHDVAPDGRFIMARRVAPDTDLDAPLVVVENWFEELRRLLRVR